MYSNCSDREQKRKIVNVRIRMKISIITVVFNQEQYIRDAIESVLGQDYSDIEYILIDGGSQDGTMDIVRAYGNRISVVVSEKDKGLYDALNKGIRLATGDYVGLVHSDDMLYDGHVIGRIVEEVERTHCDVLYGNGVYVPPFQLDRQVRNWMGGTYTKRKMRWGWLPLHTTVYVKRELYLRHGVFDASYKIAGDTELLVRYFYLLDLNIAYLDEYIIRMRLGGKSTSFANSVEKWKEDWKLYRQYKLPPYALPCKVIRKVPQYIRQKDFYT